MVFNPGLLSLFDDNVETDFKVSDIWRSFKHFKRIIQLNIMSPGASVRLLLTGQILWKTTPQPVFYNPTTNSELYNACHQCIDSMSKIMRN